MICLSRDRTANIGLPCAGGLAALPRAAIDTRVCSRPRSRPGITATRSGLHKATSIGRSPQRVRSVPLRQKSPGFHRGQCRARRERQRRNTTSSGVLRSQSSAHIHPEQTIDVMPASGAWRRQISGAMLLYLHEVTRRGEYRRRRNGTSSKGKRDASRVAVLAARDGRGLDEAWHRVRASARAWADTEVCPYNAWWGQALGRGEWTASASRRFFTTVNGRERPVNSATIASRANRDDAWQGDRPTGIRMRRWREKQHSMR